MAVRRGRPLKEHVLPRGLRGRLARGVRAARLARGLTQESLAGLIRGSASYVRRLERGVENPGLAVLERLARALKVDVVDLFPRPARRPD